MVSSSHFYGGATEISISANYTLAPRMSRVQIVTPTTSGLKVVLQNARNFQRGGPQFYIVNKGPDSIIIANNALTTLATVNANEVGVVILSNNTTNAGNWHVQVKSVGSATNALPAEYHYVAMGQTSTLGVTNKTVEYNQQLDVMTYKTNSTLSDRDGPAAFRYGATYHICGGQFSANDKNLQYDPDSWTTDTVIPTTFMRHAAAHIGGDGFIFGGRTTGVSDSTTRRRAYTFSAGSWTAKTSRPSGRELEYCGAAKAANNKIYMVGGYNGGSFNMVDEYVVDTYAAKAGRPAPSSTQNCAIAALSSVFCFGGLSGAAGITNAVSYNYGTDVWSTITPMPDFQTTAMSGSVVGDVIQLMGGLRYVDFSNNNPTTKNTQYNPLTDSYAVKQPLANALSEAFHHGQACTR